MNENKTNINWYPGHMAKTKRLIKEKIKLVDLVFEVIDARIPFSSKLKEIDEYLNDKEKILIMTKIDLADQEETKKWVKYYQSLGYLVITLNLLTDKTNLIESELKNKLKLINEKLAVKKIKKSILRAL
ncbi:MAG: ribosome biogenesis GTPase YlqF, partial [Bacilli bacterium]